MTTPTNSRAYRSGLYVLSASVVVKVIAFARTIVVARILLPAQVGRFAVAAAAVSAIDAVSDPGVVAALIQMSEVSPSTVAVAWTVLLMRGAALSVLAFLMAPVVSALVRAPDTVELLRVMAVLPLVHSMGSLAPSLLEREVDLRPSALIEVASAAVETVVTVCVAVWTRSAWSLVAGTLVGAASGVAASYAVRGFTPALRCRMAEVRRLLRFGRWVSLANTLNFVSVSGDDLLVGRFTGIRPLGLYRMAYRVANIPTTEVTHVLSRVAFPTLAEKHRDADADVGPVFHRSLVLVGGLSAVAAVLLAVLAHDLVATLLGPPWLQAAVPLSILALGGYLRAVVASGGPLFLATGRPQWDTAMQAVRSVVLLATLALLLGPFGIKGAAVASSLSVVAVVPVWLVGLGRVGIGAHDSVRVLLGRLPAVAIAGVVAAVISWSVASVAWGLVLGAGTGAATWIALTYRWDPVLRDELRYLGRRLRSGALTAGSE